MQNFNNRHIPSLSQGEGSLCKNEYIMEGNVVGGMTQCTLMGLIFTQQPSNTYTCMTPNQSDLNCGWDSLKAFNKIIPITTDVVPGAQSNISE